MTRYENPYQGFHRERGFRNLWFGAVPGSNDASGTVVACAYWIEESIHTVRCYSFATLRLPL